MKKNIRVVAAGAGLALALGTLGAAQAATVTTIRQADLVGDTTVAGGASFQFLGDGIAVKVPNDSTAFARAVWKAGNTPLSSVTSISSDWIGTQGRPGIRLDVDLDADGKPDGQLVSESAYGTQDVWLNRDIGDYAGVTPTLPAGTFQSAAPCNGQTAAAGVTDPCGSSGSQYHGTLANWAKQLQAKTGRTPVVYSAGFGASGVVQEGVLRTVTVGDTQYTFTNQAAPKSATTISIVANKDTAKPGRKVTLSGVVKPVGAGATVAVQRKNNGTWKTKTTVPVTATSGAWTATVKLPSKPGAAKFRAVVSETTTTLSATSDTVKVVVKPKGKKK